MSSSGPMTSQLATDVLMILWRAGEKGAGAPMQDLLRQTLAPLPHVQETLENLAAMGCQIERTPAEVRLASVGIRAWRELLVELARRERWRIGRQVHVLPTASSTNDRALLAIEAADGDGLVVLADQQTAGRGRLGRQWVAKSGQSVLVSFLLLDVAADSVDRLTLLAGLAAATALERAAEQAGAGVPRIEIKWPNDLQVNGKKLGGILVERRVAGGTGAGGSQGGTVVGIGINIGQGKQDFPPELSGRATSLFESCGRMIDRARVIAALLSELNGFCARPLAEEAWLGAWKARCPLLGQTVKIRSGERTAAGRVLDVSPLQGLVIRDSAGATHFFSAQTATLVD